MGAGFTILAILLLVTGFRQSSDDSQAFLLPFIGSVLAAVICFVVADRRRRVAQIETRLELNETHDSD